MTNFKVKKPIVTVYMPVFNTAAYLDEAIQSILSQTYSNFEFIIIDDASTDNSWKIIRSYARKDKRIRCFRNPLNLGVSLTSNIAISLARGKYIARMDSDDISTSDRLQKQLQYLRSHPNTILVAGQCTIIDDLNQITGTKSFPTDPQSIYQMMFWAVPVQQGYAMINLRKIPQDFTWYSSTKTSAEEVDLYFRLIKLGNFANLKDNLYFYRQLPKSLSHRDPKRTFYLTLQSRLIALRDGYQPSLFAVAMNLAQLVAITLLPSKSIYSLWYLVRGINHLWGKIFIDVAPLSQKTLG